MESKNEPRELELLRALLMLARWYKVDAGPIDALDRVRASLATFPVGVQVLEEDVENRLSSLLLEDERVSQKCDDLCVITVPQFF